MDAKDHNDFIAAAREAEVYRLYGPEWQATDLPAICAIAGAENYYCVNFANSQSE